MKLFLDLETYNEQDINVGTYQYAETVEVMLFAYAIDDQPAKVWDVTEGDCFAPFELSEALKHADVIMAHHAQFDRVMLKSFEGFRPAWDVSRWECTMARAMAHSLPGGLEKLCEIAGFGEEQSKIKDGKALVQLFCKPRPKNHKLRRATRLTHPAEWERFKVYAARDVEALRALDKWLPRWNYSGRELELWRLDQRINDRGITIDRQLAEAAVRAAKKTKAELKVDITEKTNGAVTSATQRDNLLEYILQELGVLIPDMRTKTLEKLLEIEGDTLPPEVVDLIDIRLQASQTTQTKYAKLLKAVSSDDRIRGLLAFCGALRTGRWAGRVFQPQNLKRPPRHLKKQIDFAIETLKLDAAELFFDNIMELLGACIRGALVAAPGKKLVVTDLANIEGRVLAWLAGEEWKLQAFRDYDTIIGYDADGEPIRKGPDLYVLAFSRSFNKPLDQVDDDDRQIGKVEELALGFQGGPGAFNAMAQVYGVELELDEQVKTVRAWRAANPMIASWWYELDRAVREAVSYPDRVIECRKVKIAKQGAWLMILLPSGRRLCYPSARINEDDKIVYWGVNQYTRKWEEITTYGGKLAENITQALARDVLAYNMPTVELMGYDILLTVHDELITESEDRPEYSAAGLSEVLSTVPPWAEGLPLAAKGWEGHRYKKD